MARIVSVNIGSAQPSLNAPKGWTGIDKRPTNAAVLVRAPGPERGKSGVAGDTVCDDEHHGGDNKAVYVYASESLQRWEHWLDRALQPGSFGENLTTADLDVDNALIGERWRIGHDLVLEVAGPRTPCRTFAGWLDRHDLVRRFNEAELPGAYLRVVEPGEVQAGDEVHIEFRPDHDVSVAMTFRAKTSERSLLPYVAKAPGQSESVVSAAQRYLERHRP